MTSLKQMLEQIHWNISENPEINTLDLPAARKTLDEILNSMSRPFDPVECGFEEIGFVRWELGKCILQKNNGVLSVVIGLDSLNCPWPENHFDGVRLLLSLGVIKEGE